MKLPTHSPADAMSALAPEFNVAYIKATTAVLDAVLEFERTTRRVVDRVEVGYMDITRLMDTEQRLTRSFQIHFLPRSDEVTKK